MQKIMIIFMALLILTTGCKAENGNSVSKLETTIYKTYHHNDIVIEDAFEFIKKEFTEEDTFYHASLLTIEYGVDNTEVLEKEIKEKLSAYEVLYLNFSFETGDVSYKNMKSNHTYNYTVYLVKYSESDTWHIHQMQESFKQ